MSETNPISVVFGLVASCAGIAIMISSCQDKNGPLKEDYNAAATCTQKLKANEACTLEEQKSKERVNKNEMKGKEGEVLFWFGQSMMN